MRKLVMGVTASLIAGLAISPAHAVGNGTIYFEAGSSTMTTRKPGNTVTLENFDNINSPKSTFTGSGAGVNSRTNTGPGAPNHTPPTYESTGNYAYVTGNVAMSNSYSITFAPAQVFTFILGSLDQSGVDQFGPYTGNILTLTFQDGSTKRFEGGEIIGQTATTGRGANGRVIYDAQGAPNKAIVGALFTSGNGGTFEFDNIATAAPELATWMTMIVGFGVAGTALRRGYARRQAVA